MATQPAETSLSPEPKSLEQKPPPAASPEPVASIPATSSQDTLLASVTKNLTASPMSPPGRLDILHQSFEPQSMPADIPHFDAAFLNSLERNAHTCAQNITHLLATLRITSLSTSQLEAYRQSVDSLKNAVHLSVLASHELVQKSQQLHEDMKGVETVAAQVREMKRMMDSLEVLALQYEKQQQRKRGSGV